MIESAETTSSSPELTPRMQDVLNAVLNGAYTQADIAKSLGIEVTTLKVITAGSGNYQEEGGLYRRLGVPNLTGAVVEALKSGLVEFPNSGQQAPGPEYEI